MLVLVMLQVSRLTPPIFPSANALVRKCWSGLLLPLRFGIFLNPGFSPGFSMRNQYIHSRCRGFTIIELIVVIVIAGILAAFVAPKWRGGTGFEERGFRDQVAAALRYAQKSAIAARRTVCVTSTTAPSTMTFAISNAYGAADCSAGVPLVGPDGQVFALAAMAPAAFSSAPASLVFDAAGRPSGAATFSFTGLPGALDLTVEAETGYVR